MPKKSFGPVVSPEAERAEEILEITTLFAEALDELNMQYASALDENAEIESSARKSLGFSPVPGKISEVLA